MEDSATRPSDHGNHCRIRITSILTWIWDAVGALVWRMEYVRCIVSDCVLSSQEVEGRSVSSDSSGCSFAKGVESVSINQVVSKQTRTMVAIEVETI